LCKLVSGDFAFNFYHNIWESMFNIKIHIMKKINLMTNLSDFLGEYWKIVLSCVLLLVLITLIIFVHTPSVGLIIVMALNAVVFTVIALATQSQSSHLVNIISMSCMWLLSALGIDAFYCLFPVGIMGLNAVAQEFSGVVVFFFLALNLMLLGAIHDHALRNQARLPENRIEAVITEIEKRDHNDIMVVLDTKDGLRILPFSSTVDDAWRLEKGDTISVSIYNDAIIAFDKNR